MTWFSFHLYLPKHEFEDRLLILKSMAVGIYLFKMCCVDLLTFYYYINFQNLLNLATVSVIG